MEIPPKSSYPKVLFGLFILIWVGLAIKPLYRFDWLLENLLIFFWVPLLILGYRKNIFTNTSYTLLFIFIVFHSIGAHYTYSEVPIDKLIGETGGRNHYDRFVHFIFGGLLFYPARELFTKLLKVQSKMWLNYLAMSFIIVLGTCYELLEWITAIIVDKEAGSAFLGMQGDVFDTQKDIALNISGALIAVLIIFFTKPKQAGNN